MSAPAHPMHPTHRGSPVRRMWLVPLFPELAVTGLTIIPDAEIPGRSSRRNILSRYVTDRYGCFIDQVAISIQLNRQSDIRLCGFQVVLAVLHIYNPCGIVIVGLRYKLSPS